MTDRRKFEYVEDYIVAGMGFAIAVGATHGMREDNYSFWVNGCSVGQGYATLEDCKTHAVEVIRKKLHFEEQKAAKRLAEIRECLDAGVMSESTDWLDNYKREYDGDQ